MSDYTEEELSIKKLKIEKGVPMRARYPHGAFAALVRNMSIGDSIYCDDSRQITGLSLALNKLGMCYETRKEGEGRRIWRTK